MSSYLRFTLIARRNFLEESDEYPLYCYDDEMAARVLSRASRAYLARKAIYILRRNKLR